MDNNDCKCFVRICGTRAEIKNESNRFINYLKDRDYKGIMRSKHILDGFKIDLDCDIEVHFVLATHYGRWCLGRIYKFLGADDFEKVFQSGHEYDMGVS